MADVTWRKRAVLFVLLFVPFVLQAKVYLVSVGIADYPGRENDLYLPVNDAREITWLYRKSSQVTFCQLLDSEATVDNIVAAMNIFLLAKPDDIVVFYYSGHGYPGGLAVYDGCLSYVVIRAAMAKSKCKNKMIFSDACFAAGITTTSSSVQEEAQQAEKANVMLFLSSRSDEYSLQNNDMKNAYFTHFLQKGLRGGADANKDRVITAKELFVFVYRRTVEKTAGQQHPVMWGNFSDDMPVMIWKK